MKEQLMLFQPKQYNELFSTYHNTKTNLNQYSRVNLPKLSTIFAKEIETAVSTSKTNRTTNSTINNNIFKNIKNLSSKKSSNLFDRKKDIFYPILTQQRECETSRVSQFLPFPTFTQHFKTIIDKNAKAKKKIEKNNNDLKMIYLNLIHKENNNNDYKIESFLTENEENEITKNDYTNSQISDINNKRKAKDMFNQTSNSKIKNEISMLNNIPIILINSFAQDIYNSYYRNEYKTKAINNKKPIKNNVKKIYNNKYKNLYRNNKFFKYVLDNVKHKIELISENNKSISVLYVTNLINNELKYLQKQISSYEKQYCRENTSNNISKISNYEITSNNTFKFKTNNNSSIRDNENISTNNNSSVIGSLIKKNIYFSRNNNLKKIKFDTLNMYHIDPNILFQNKEIISSIKNKNESKTNDNKNAKKIKIVMNSYNKQKDLNSDDEINNKNNLTSNSVDHANSRIKSKKFNNNYNKKLEKTFSQIFLKNDYKKASYYITEISNKIENRYLYKINKHKINNNENKNKKYKYDIKNSIYYEDNKENYLVTPRNYKKSIGTNTDYRQGIKFRNEIMNSNYEKFIKNIKDIKENNNKNLFFTPNKDNLDNNEYINNKNQKQFIYNNKKLINNFDNNHNFLINNTVNEKNDSNNKINNREKYKNKDLKSIKTSKSTNKKNKDNLNDNNIPNITNSNSNYKIINKNNNITNNKNKINNYKNNNKINNNNIKNNIDEKLNKLNIKINDNEE